MLGVEPEHRDGGIPSSRIQLASRGAVICVSTGDVLVKPGETAYIRPQTDANMLQGWTNDVDELLVISAGTFVKVLLAERYADDGSNTAVVKLGGALFPEHASERQTARIAASLARPEPADAPTQAFVRYVAPTDKTKQLTKLIRSALHRLAEEPLACWPDDVLADAAFEHGRDAGTPRMQAPTEPTPRELVLQPLDEPAAAYWYTIKTARDAIDEARLQLDRARIIRNIEGNAHLITHAWFDNHLTTELLLKLRKALPDLPNTSAALDGGCVNSGDSGC